MTTLKLSDQLAVQTAQVKWFIAPSKPIKFNALGSLVAEQRSHKNRVKLSYFSSRYLQEIQRYKLQHTVREELKARLRRKMGLKGNIRELHFTLGHAVFNFDIDILSISGFAYLLITSRRFKPTLSANQLKSLSELPLDPMSVLNDLSRKCFAILQAGNRHARPTDEVKVSDCFPSIHLTADCHQTHQPWKDIVDWRSLATIGLRHPVSDQEDLPLIDRYKQKNLCLRQHLVLVDKQSMLVLSDRAYVENDGMFVTCLLSKHLSYILNGFIDYPSDYSQEDILLLLDRLENSLDLPSLISESETTLQRWPVILKTFKIDERLKGARQAIEQASRYQVSPQEVVTRLDHLARAIADKLGDWPYSYNDLGQKTGEEGLTLARKTLEKIVDHVILHLHKLGMKESTERDLYNKIELLKKEDKWRDTMPEARLDKVLGAYMDFIREVGNRGAHPQGQHFISPRQSLNHAARLLAEVMTWFAHRFLKHAILECPSCGERSPNYNKFCLCGHQFEQPWYQSCRCKFEAREIQTRCLQCGNPFVRKGEEAATIAVHWKA